MVPFELTWLLDITGMPTGVCGYYGKTIEMGVDIDDSYSFALRFPDLVGAVTCDVVVAVRDAQPLPEPGARADAVELGGQGRACLRRRGD